MKFDKCAQHALTARPTSTLYEASDVAVSCTSLVKGSAVGQTHRMMSFHCGLLGQLTTAAPHMARVYAVVREEFP